MFLQRCCGVFSGGGFGGVFLFLCQFFFCSGGVVVKNCCTEVLERSVAQREVL